METEEALEDAYQSYLERRGAREAAARVAAAKRARIGDDGELADADADETDDPVCPLCCSVHAALVLSWVLWALDAERSGAYKCGMQKSQDGGSGCLHLDA